MEVEHASDALILDNLKKMAESVVNDSDQNLETGHNNNDLPPTTKGILLGLAASSLSNGPLPSPPLHNHINGDDVTHNGSSHNCSPLSTKADNMTPPGSNSRPQTPSASGGHTPRPHTPRSPADRSPQSKLIMGAKRSGDGIQCGECSQSFNVMQDYMQHACDKGVGEPLSDGESFDGKIVYNPDGSAYIIEGESDLSDNDSLLDVPQVEGSIVIDSRVKTTTSQVPSFPQIANAFYIQRNPAAFYNTFYMFPPESRPRVEAPIMHSYRVYDVRSGKKSTDFKDNTDQSKATGDLDDDSQSSSSNNKPEDGYAATVPTKPILMCFICKLSFGYVKSFVAHAIGEHEMELSEEEKGIISKKNASAIIQGVGKDKNPLMSFLEPNCPPQFGATLDGAQTSPEFPIGLFPSSGSSGTTGNTKIAHNSIANTSVSYSLTSAKPSTLHNSNSEESSVKPTSSPLNAHSKPQGANCSSPSAQTAAQREPPSPVPRPVTLTKDGSEATRTSRSPVSSGGGSRPSTPRVREATPASTNDAEFFGSNSVLTSPQPGLCAPVSPSITSSNHIATSNSMMSPNNMMLGCEEHPMGNTSGMDCPKCDMIMAQRSMGGQMTLMHSRNSCKTLKCPKCNWHYKYQETLEIHMKEKHPENDTQCLYCITGQPHPRLSRGEVYTCGYKPYRCDVCNYSTTTKGNLSIHMQSDKHINNMQELQSGNVEMKMVPQHPAPQPPPPPPPPQQLPSAQDAMMKNKKPKPSWRCDVCNYETNVARNLRIHMTSEKHTHNMMVLQQNMKHMQRDMHFQLSQMAIMGQDRLMGLQPPISPHAMPPFYDPSMFLPPFPMEANPMDLSKENNMPLHLAQVPPSVDLKNNNNEPSKIFHCSVCNVFSADNVEALHQHMQLDRSKHSNQDNVMVVSGTYMCNLCAYKTTLKANFQLHCKTDKHLQRLQLVNHIREGGHHNEWRLKYMNMSNPIQVKCNACDYYTNSMHKLQLHTSNTRHEANAKLFRHLQSSEAKIAGDKKYYHCTLCNYSTRAKLNLIQHVRSMKHMRHESLRILQLREMGKEHEYDLQVIFTVKEYTDGEAVNFDEADEDGEQDAAGAEEEDEEMEEELDHVSEEESARDSSPPSGSGGPLPATGSAESGSSGRPTGDQIRMCPYCNFSTVSESRLQAHVSSAHAGAGTAPVNLPCPLCAEKFPEKSQLGLHLTSLHNVGREARNNLLAMVMVDTSSSPVPAATLSTPPTPNAKSPGELDGKPDTVRDNEHTPKSELNKSENSKSDGPSTTESACDGEVDAIRIGEDGSIDAVNISEKGEPEDQYRCQMCTLTFTNIDGLYAHQNEQNHLELKNTPRGPGYLCWKKGCNQYFKTAQALQVHFREIHDKRDQLSVSERHVYKYRCTQCSLAFKTLDKLQLHTHYHVIRAATKCSMCGRSFRSISALRKHVEENHLDTMTEAELDQYRSSLAAAPPMMLNMSDAADNPDSDGEESQSANSKDAAAEDEDEEMMEESVDGITEGTEGSSFEDYLNSQAIAEDSYIDPNRKYKCHRCKVAFTKQSYLVAHNRTVMHRKGDKSISYPMDKYLDPNRPYKCDICKESFTQKNILLVHFNSVSHLHKKKQADQQQDAPTASSSPSSSTSVPPLSPAAATTSAPSSATSSSNSSDDKKPYKCNICKVSYSQGTTLDIHMRSVLHQTKASKLQELVLTGQVDPTQPLIEQPDMTKAQQQQQKVIQDMMQMQKAAQQLSPGMAIGQPQVMFPLMPTPPGVVPPSSQSSQTNAQSQNNASQGSQSTPRTSSTPDPTPADRSSQNPTPQPQSKPDTPSSTSEVADAKEIENSVSACNRCSSIFASHEALVQHQQMYCFPNPRYMARFKPHVQKNLLENFGFECVMQFNEFNQRRKKPEPESESKQKVKDEESAKEEKTDADKENRDEESMEVDETRTDEVKEEKKEKIDMPELNKCLCQKCEKEFSSIWVLKAHQEEVHKEIVPIDMVEEFSAKFRENYEKKQPQPIVIEPQPSQSQPSTPKTPVSEKRSQRESTEVKMELPPGFEQLGIHPNMLGMDLAAAQMMQMPLFNMMPMNMMNMIPMNMPMAMNMHPPLMPMMMPMGPDAANFASIPGMPPMMDPNFLMKQQQQQQAAAAAAAAAAQNKRARTRISDDQLKILRAYFDINNSPSEDQIQEMSDKSGLPQKVIKHWFRNTLFKERQRNKDSPYNFNIPPSTSLNLEEYERTGKLPTETNNNSDEQNKNREQEEGKIEVKQEKTNTDQEQGSASASVASTVDSQDQESVSGSESATESSAPASASSTPVPPSATHSEIVSALNSSPFTHHLSKFDAASLASHLHHAPPHLQLNPAGHLSLGHPKSHGQVPPNSLQLTSPPGSQLNPPGSSATKRANRTRFTDYQIKVLQEFFEQNAYPKDDDLDQLSKMLNLSPRVIVVWFQNARQKARKNYENQPPLDMSEDGTRYQRTPGLNYQCKKCLTVFQRYYELIRHQKTHCYKDTNNSNASRGSSLIVSPQNSQDSFKSENSTTPERTPEKPPPTSSSAKTSTPTSSSSLSSTAGQYKCDKCNLTFNRFDLWHEHQNVHVMNPSLFPNFPADSAFAMLQSVAQQQQQQQQQQLHKEHLPLTPNQIKQEDLKSPQKRKASDDSHDDDDSGSIKNDHDQPRDKRLRTTILPEQLDYLYQKYQIDCNPSRKQLESIAEEVGLKKRVVQVWFQNTRARERKGQYRAHQQLIHKRCPFCRALFRNRSALESHLATKHPEEMAKGNVTIDSIPDATIESLNSPVTSSTPVSSATSPANSLDMSKLMANPFNMPEPFVPFMPPGSAGLPSPNFPGAMQVNMKRLYEDSLKKYLDELSGASHAGKMPAVPEAHTSTSSSQRNTGTIATPSSQSTVTSSKVKEDPDTPLDLSKPVDLSRPVRSDPEERAYDEMNRSMNFDDSMSETKSECNLSEFGDSNPASPNTSTASSSSFNAQKDRSLTPGQLHHQNKRFRTQMTSLQVKVMKNLFTDYKTPTMAECEMLGREIGLPKRVIQVWFQNARAKEKKSKLTYSKTFGTDLEVPRPPEECKLCNFKYSHKYTIQDHIFTKRHIENVKGYISNQAESQQDYIDPTTMTQLMRQREMERGPKSLTANLTSPAKGASGSGAPGADAQQLAGHPHLAQLHAMGLQALSSPGHNQEKPASAKKEGRAEQKSSEKKRKDDDAKAANPFGMPGIQGQVDFGAGYMPYLYPGMGSFYPGVGMLPGVVPGVMPGAESMFMYDPSTFGTPLTLLQIPSDAIAAVQAKVQDASCTLTHYCQDNGTVKGLKARLSAVDAQHLSETRVDVGFICKKCHMVYPGQEGCANHQQSLCYQGEKQLADMKTMVKLEQLQYSCTACNASYNVAKEFMTHIATDAHKKKVKPSDGGDAATSEPNSASQTPETSDGQ